MSTPAKRLPLKLKRSLADFADTERISIEEATFCALVALGYDLKAAYLFIRPDVKPESAKTKGSVWKRKLLKHINSLSVYGATHTLWDFELLRMSVDRKLPPDVRLKAVDMGYKRDGRYAEPGVTINIGTQADDALGGFEVIDAEVE